MPDTFTSTTSTSWGSNLFGSIKSVLFGFVLFVISFPLLIWNEGRAVHTAKGLTEGQGPSYRCRLTPLMRARKES